MPRTCRACATHAPCTLVLAAPHSAALRPRYGRATATVVLPLYYRRATVVLPRTHLRRRAARTLRHLPVTQRGRRRELLPQPRRFPRLRRRHPTRHFAH